MTQAMSRVRNVVRRRAVLGIVDSEGGMWEGGGVGRSEVGGVGREGGGRREEGRGWREEGGGGERKTLH